MLIKERVIREAMRRIEKRVKVIDELIYANPWSEIIELHSQAKKLLAEAGNDYASISKEMEQLAAAEKKQLALVKQQKKGAKLTEEQVRIESEHGELRSELFFMSQRGQLSDQPIPGFICD